MPVDPPVSALPRNTEFLGNVGDRAAIDQDAFDE